MHLPTTVALSAELRWCRHGSCAHSPRHTQLPGGTITRRQYSCSYQEKKKSHPFSEAEGQGDQGFFKGKANQKAHKD